MVQSQCVRRRDCWFTPDPGAEKLFDALYVGRLLPFKRFELAAGIPRLAAVTAPYGVEEPYAAALNTGAPAAADSTGERAVMAADPGRLEALSGKMQA